MRTNPARKLRENGNDGIEKSGIEEKIINKTYHKYLLGSSSKSRKILR